MKEMLLAPLAILAFIFYLPGLMVWIPITLFRVYILKHKVNTDAPRKGFCLKIASIVLWTLIIGWNIYQNQFYSISYVYACPADDMSSKCYKVKADYVPEECADDEYGKYVIKGDCRDPYFGTIHFNNGGSITFADCI